MVCHTRHAANAGRTVPGFEWLGRQPYEPMWRRLQQHAEAVAGGEAKEIIWVCEHEPVYTTGTRGVDNRVVNELPAPLVHTDRGGETTFHGHGQIVFYPIISLRQRRLGVKQYVRLLEQSCINLLASLSVQSVRRCGFPGVWTDGGKIAALGVRVLRGVAYHGMAMNVSVEPRWFAAINPCGTGEPVVNLASLCIPPLLCNMAQQWYVYFHAQLEG